jgi:hypothetical protein
MPKPVVFGVTTVILLGLSIFCTVRPLQTQIVLGGCVDQVSTVYRPGSFIGEMIRTGGNTQVIEPDTSQPEYGCAPSVYTAIVPIDLYILTGLLAGLTIWRTLRRT